MHLSNVTVQQRDARIPVPEEAGKADVLLCDLPCSGLGVIGRKRDIKYHVTEKQLEELSVLQKDILRSAVPYLRKGGVLIYSTCTINEGENGRIADFITAGSRTLSKRNWDSFPIPWRGICPERSPGSAETVCSSCPMCTARTGSSWPDLSRIILKGKV